MRSEDRYSSKAVDWIIDNVSPELVGCCMVLTVMAVVYIGVPVAIVLIAALGLQWMGVL